MTSRPDGILMLSAGVLLEYATAQNTTINLVALIACSACYIACYVIIRDPKHNYK
ncbi:unnamed protein product, partial [Strongylus vulgaris]